MFCHHTFFTLLLIIIFVAVRTLIILEKCTTKILVIAYLYRYDNSPHFFKASRSQPEPILRTQYKKEQKNKLQPTSTSASAHTILLHLFSVRNH